MKIKELLDVTVPHKDPSNKEENLINALNSSSNFDFNYRENIMNHSLIRTNLSKIKECEEFEDCEIFIVSRPLLEDKEGNPLQVLTLFLQEGLKFKDRCYLYSIQNSEQGVIVRGLFESWEINGEIKNNNTYDVDMDSEPKYGMVFYMTKEEGNEEGLLNMKMNSKAIPIDLQEAYYEKFGKNNFNVTEEMINEFLKENK